MIKEKFKKHDIEEALYKNKAHNIAVIGVGNMGQVLTDAIIASDLRVASDIVLANRTFADLNIFAQAGINIFRENREAAIHADTIFIAVKPGQVLNVLREINPYLNKEKTIVSVAAGVTTMAMNSVFKNLGDEKPTIIRAMPNLASKFGLGVTGWFSNDKLDLSHENLIESIFGAMGIVIRAKTEDGIDRLTAVAGSMIGFQFHLSEAIARVTSDLLDDVPPEISAKIARQVAKGAQFMLENDGRTASELRIAVTSEGGTTFAGLKFFENHNLTEILAGGVKAAYNRSVEIGREII